MTTPGEWIGNAVGVALAPIVGAISFGRQARMLHPEGLLFRAEVIPVAQGAISVVADRLAGPALVRFSSALWRKGREWPDALGVAMRFRSTPVMKLEADPGDQDLLFATIRSPWTTPFAPLTTKVHDFLANDYYAVSPFRVDGLGRVKWRLVPERVSARGSRAEKLRGAVEGGSAVLQLEAKSLGIGGSYFPVAAVRLMESLQLDDQALRFSPFLTGRGIRPEGLVHSIRHAVYAVSQGVRPKHG